MIFEGFEIHASPFLTRAYCKNKKCKKKPELMEVSNGMFSSALFCRDCHSVYIIKMEQVKKVPKEFMQQCLNEVARENRKRKAVQEFDELLANPKKK